LRTNASITLLVNNAGVGVPTPFLAADIGKTDQMIELNVTALVRLTYAVMPAFVARSKGAVINISSALGIAPELLNGVYGGTKALVLPLVFHSTRNSAGAVSVFRPSCQVRLLPTSGTSPQCVGDRFENCTKNERTPEGESRRIGW
jgi:hypothetical protein